MFLYGTFHFGNERYVWKRKGDIQRKSSENAFVRFFAFGLINKSTVDWRLRKKDASVFTPLEAACVNQKYLATMQMSLSEVEARISSSA